MGPEVVTCAVKTDRRQQTPRGIMVIDRVLYLLPNGQQGHMKGTESCAPCEFMSSPNRPPPHVYFMSLSHYRLLPMSANLKQ